MCYILKKYLKIQRHELEEHKYYLSEKKGYDVGYNETVFDWITTGNAVRFKKAYTENYKKIEEACKATCGDDCGGLEACVLAKEKLHELLGDNDEVKDKET